jgi:peptide-methionine (R)-S-oxide reductase
MAPSRTGLHRGFSFSAATLLLVAAALAAEPQDPFQKAEPPGGNSDGTAAAKSPADSSATSKGDPKAKSEPEFVWKTPEQWRRILTYEQFVVTRMKGTEAPYSGRYSRGHFRGTFLCVCCGAELFDAETKFESGTGWPSFWQPINEKAVTYAVDNSAAEIRTEVNCRRCGAHLGHVFDDGPPPTGHRYCMNSVALKLRPSGGATANKGATGRSKTKVKSKAKSKPAKSQSRSAPQSSKSPENATPSNSQAPDRNHSEQPDRAPAATSDRP